jgi:hypothetical protein
MAGKNEPSRKTGTGAAGIGLSPGRISCFPLLQNDETAGRNDGDRGVEAANSAFSTHRFRFAVREGRFARVK